VYRAINDQMPVAYAILMCLMTFAVYGNAINGTFGWAGEQPFFEYRAEWCATIGFVIVAFGGLLLGFLAWTYTVYSYAHHAWVAAAVSTLVFATFLIALTLAFASTCPGKASKIYTWLSRIIPV